jgi:hypothetical protein
MKIPSLFKTPRYRKFEFRPRYYNPEKEAFEERILKQEKKSEASFNHTEQFQLRLKEHIRSNRKLHKPGQYVRSNSIIMIIIALLSALSYWILMG